MYGANINRPGTHDRVSPKPQSTDSAVPYRPCSLRARSWAFSAGMKRTFLTGLPRRPGGTVWRPWLYALLPTAPQKPKGYGITMRLPPEWLKGLPARPDPCCRLGGVRVEGAHGVPFAITEGRKAGSGW
jgi:hypothetical protein